MKNKVVFMCCFVDIFYRLVLRNGVKPSFKWPSLSHKCCYSNARIIDAQYWQGLIRAGNVSGRLIGVYDMVWFVY